jgi:hypothetical protein
MGSNCTINLLLMSDSDFVVFSAVRSLADIDLAVGSLLNITNSTSDSLIFVTSNAINVVFWAANLSQTERVSFSYELGFTPSEGNVFSDPFWPRSQPSLLAAQSCWQVVLFIGAPIILVGVLLIVIPTIALSKRRPAKPKSVQLSRLFQGPPNRVLVQMEQEVWRPRARIVFSSLTRHV